MKNETVLKLAFRNTHVNTERRQTETIRRPALLPVDHTVEEELHQAGDIAEEGLHPLVDLLAIEVLQQVAVAFLRRGEKKTKKKTRKVK